MSSSLELVGILCPKLKKDIHSYCLDNPKLKMFIWSCFNHCLRFLFDSLLKKNFIHTFEFVTESLDFVWVWSDDVCHEMFDICCDLIEVYTVDVFGSTPLPLQLKRNMIFT